MSFVEFLLEYYIYILAVLVVLIVGVIGFLVDSKNKEKKKSSVDGGEASNVVVNPAATDGVVADNVVVNPAAADGVGGNNLNNIMPDMVASPVSNNEVDLVQSIQPVLNNEVANPAVSNNDLNSISSFQPSMVNNGQMVGGADVNVVNNQNPVQFDVYGVNNNPTPVVPVQVANGMSTNFGQSNVMGVPSEQSVMANEPQPNVGFNAGMDSNINNIQNLQPVMPTNGVNADNSNVSLNNGINFNYQNQVMGNANGMLGQSVMSGGSQGSLNSGINVQQTNMVGQNGSNSNLVSNNNVVTTDGSQPFDISSMFPNNQ